MVYQSLVRRATELSSRSLSWTPTPAAWQAELDERRRQWLWMLGLDPLPERTDLQVTETGRLDRGDYQVEKIVLQPVPGCYIGANVYRPTEITEPLPAVVYVCGHAGRGKAWYQPHARWFGRHGYVCLILDTIEIGEHLKVGTHHGTFTEGWWHWISQGYSPGGVEVWYAMRVADYLQSRDDVDGSRLGITGNSGGGSISWYTGAADERFSVVVPSCQTGTMEQHIRDRTLDGHCDCAVWVNTLGWDLPDVGALIAPRNLLVASATEDAIWRPWANRDVLLRLRKLYRRLGIEERFDVVEDVMPHGYSPRTRCRLFSWFEQYLKGNLTPVTEDIDDAQNADEDLLAFPGGQPPADDRTPDIHTFFIPLPDPPAVTDAAAWQMHQQQAIARLKETTFRHVPTGREVPAYSARPRGWSGGRGYTSFDFEPEPGLSIRAWLVLPVEADAAVPVLVGAVREDCPRPTLARGTGLAAMPAGVGSGSVEVRATGNTAIGVGLDWFVKRAYPTLGCSLPERRLLDLLRGIDILREQPGVTDIAVYGRAETAPGAIYAALLDERITEVVLEEPVTTHWQAGPEFPNVLQVGDLPHNLALLCPRPITFVGAMPEAFGYVRDVYVQYGAGAQLRVIPELAEWAPA